MSNTPLCVLRQSMPVKYRLENFERHNETNLQFANSERHKSVCTVKVNDCDESQARKYF